MARKQHEQADSLEMLLDTMCNAFGGIILIAIMIAIMAKPPTPEGGDPEAELVKIQIQVKEPQSEDLAAELDELVKKAQVIDPAVTNLVVQKNELAVKVTAAKTTMDNLASTPEQKKELAAKIKAQQAANAQKSKEVADAQMQMARVQAQLNQANKGEPVTIRAPRARGTKKEPAWVIIQHGKIWAAERFVDGKKELNKTTFKREIRAGTTYFTPVPGKGVDILQNRRVSPTLANYLVSIPKESYYLQIQVHKDSFSDFRVFKELFLKKGIQYNWEPEKEDIELVFGPASTGRPGVQ